jgi:hypothetical protein
VIIGIVGRTGDKRGNFCSLGTGKDTAADALEESEDFVKVALADPMKRFCRDVYGFSVEQLWGPSSARNEPDKRYPRERHVNAGDSCACCGSAYQELVGYDSPTCFLTPRYALQQIGSEWGRNCYTDTWVDYLLNVANKLLAVSYGEILRPPWYSYDKTRGIFPHVSGNVTSFEFRGLYADEIRGVVCSDVRFQNEMQRIKSAGGKIVLIHRVVDEVPRNANIAHQSEVDLSAFPPSATIWDKVVHNDGDVDELKFKMCAAVKELRATL